MSLSTLTEAKSESGNNDKATEQKTESDRLEGQKSHNVPAEEPPDGGYGWVVVGCCFMLNAAVWGCTGSFGVFLSYYRKNNYFPEATDTDYTFILGMLMGVAFLISPFTNYLSKRFNFKVPMIIGSCFFVLSLVFAGLSKRIWQLFITQGIMFGIGLGALYVPSLPLISQWFSRRRALAAGIGAAGSGAGGLVLSLTNQVIIERLGLQWAFFIDAFIAVVVFVPVVFFLKSRDRIVRAKFQPIQYTLLWHPGFVYVWLWGFFAQYGYLSTLYFLATYSTSGLGLSQAKGASLQSILCAGQIVGRPLSGLVMDRFGRINLSVFLTFIAGLSCVAIWMVARSYGVLIFFAAVQGASGGVFWTSSVPVTVEILGISELGSALSILWLSLVIPSVLCEPIFAWLLEYSQKHLHRTGADSFLITIGFSGANFFAAALVLLGAKRWKQGNWKILTKT